MNQVPRAAPETCRFESPELSPGSSIRVSAFYTSERKLKLEVFTSATAHRASLPVCLFVFEQVAGKVQPTVFVAHFDDLQEFRLSKIENNQVMAYGPALPADQHDMAFIILWVVRDASAFAWWKPTAKLRFVTT
jgi:hypothetical protein